MKYASSVAWAVMENHGFADVFQLSSHYWLSVHGFVFQRYGATTHPSGPNYRTLACGQPFTQDEEYRQSAPSIANHVETTVLHLGTDDIAARHNPYADVCVPNLNQIRQRSLAVSVQQSIDTIMRTGTQHLYLGWDDANNGHSGSLEVADKNLNDLLDALDTSVWFNTPVNGLYPVFMFVWDEDLSLPLINHVFCAMYGRGIKPGSTEKDHTHVDFNRTMSEIYELPPLVPNGQSMLEPFQG